MGKTSPKGPAPATAPATGGEPVEVKPGDPCPQCGGAFQPAPGDSASDEQKAELGALYACASCGYKTRFKD